MRKIILATLLLVTTAFAEQATIMTIISENMIKVQTKDGIKKLHLSGIELFAKVNNDTKNVTPTTRQHLKEQSLNYMKTLLHSGEKIKYGIMATDAYTLNISCDKRIMIITKVNGNKWLLNTKG
ncbi:MAG: hypothetical protein K0U47_04030 [Epsilonproteobacteria bacterium]|nr:hypothetical protein [Campylobacterota bacterium]